MAEAAVHDLHVPTRQPLNISFYSKQVPSRAERPTVEGPVLFRGPEIRSIRIRTFSVEIVMLVPRQQPERYQVGVLTSRPMCRFREIPQF